MGLLSVQRIGEFATFGKVLFYRVFRKYRGIEGMKKGNKNVKKGNDYSGFNIHG